MPRELTAADFSPESETPWSVRLASGDVVDLLVLSTHVQSDPRPFSVLFAGPLEPELPQATFDVSHAAIGQTPLFIVPVARTADAMHYEAVFG